jgi:predicted thioesterase
MSMEKFQAGQSAELDVEVTKEATTNRMGREGAEVLSTPALLGLMENASIKASEPYLLEGYTTVGYAVDGLRHFAPTPIGERVRVKSVLTEVDRNRLTYSIEAYEGGKKIGVAVHKRAVVSTNLEAQG